MFRNIWQKKSSKNSHLLSEESKGSDISLLVYPVAEKKEEKDQLPPLPRISRDLWIKILDCCTAPEGIKLAVVLGKSGMSLLKSYVCSNEDLLLHGYFPLSKPNACSFQNKLRQVIDTEKEKSIQKEARKNSISIKVISCFALLGYGASFGVYYQGKLSAQPADLLYPHVEFSYNATKQDCDFFVINGSSCTVTQDIPCSGEHCSVDDNSIYSCDLYDSYALKCEEPPASVIPYTTPLFMRLYYCSPSFANYTALCNKIKDIKSSSIPYSLGAVGIFFATSVAAYIAYKVKCGKEEISDDLILEQQFSLWLSLNDKEKLTYKKLIHFLGTEGMTVKRALQRLEVLILMPPSDYQRCSFFKITNQLENKNEIQMTMTSPNKVRSL